MLVRLAHSDGLILSYLLRLSDFSDVSKANHKISFYSLLHTIVKLLNNHSESKVLCQGQSSVTVL